MKTVEVLVKFEIEDNENLDDIIKVLKKRNINYKEEVLVIGKVDATDLSRIIKEENRNSKYLESLVVLIDEYKLDDGNLPYINMCDREIRF